MGHILYQHLTLVGYELNYTPIERACLVVIFASQKLQHYMLNHKVKLIASIDPLKCLLNKVALTRRLEKWVMILKEIDIEYVDHKAMKGKIIADHLAKAPLQDNHPLLTDFPDDLVFTLATSTKWKLYYDGYYLIMDQKQNPFFNTSRRLNTKFILDQLSLYK